MNSDAFINQRAPHVLGSIVLVALLAVGIARVTGLSQDVPASEEVVASSMLLFEDGPAGAVQVYDYQHGALLASFPSGDGSFVRGVLRSMTRERRALEAGSDTPFLLARHRDGALTIHDQATGRTILLNAFGPDNAAVFSRLLDASQAES